MTGESTTVEPNSDWAAATAGLRSGAKWIIVSLGAIGLAVFGAGPLLTGLTFSWQDPEDRLQMIIAIGFAVVGLSGIIGLIFVVGRTFMPVMVSLSRLDEKTLRQLREDPEHLLPGNHKTLEEFEEALRNVDALTTTLYKQFKDAGPDQKTAAREAYEEAVKYRTTLGKWRASILDRDAYNRVGSNFFRPLGFAWALPVLIGLSVAGSVGFMFSLSHPAAPEDGGSESSAQSQGQVAYLTPGNDAQAWARITETADIAGCRDTATRNYLVLVLEKNDASRTVQTLPRNDDCEVWKFEVLVPDVASIQPLAEPKEIKITYSPSPTPDR